jgi:cellulose synthase operon protein C
MSCTSAHFAASLLWTLLASATPGNAGTPPPAPELTAHSESLAKAQDLLARGDAVAAEAEFRSLLVEDPDSQTALLGRAAALRLLGREPEAIPPIARAAERHLRRADDAAALSLLEGSLEVLAPHPAVLAALGDARLRARQFLSAEAALREAAALSPGNPRVLHLLAAAEWENGKVEAAELTYRSLLQTAPRDAEAWFQLGRLLGWGGRFRESLQAIENAARHGYDGPDLLIERARVLEGASSYPEEGIPAGDVARAYARAVEAAPDDYQARYGLARALRRAGEAAAAAREMREFQRLYGEHQEHTRRSGLDQAQLDVARERLRGGAPQEALAVLERMSATAETHHLRALARLALEDEDGARSELEAAIALAPERTDLRALLSRLRADPERR